MVGADADSLRRKWRNVLPPCRRKRFCAPRTRCICPAPRAMASPRSGRTTAISSPPRPISGEGAERDSGLNREADGPARSRSVGGSTRKGVDRRVVRGPCVDRPRMGTDSHGWMGKGMEREWARMTRKWPRIQTVETLGSSGWHPCRDAEIFSDGSGGVVAVLLNHRLMASMPPAWPPTAHRSLLTAHRSLLTAHRSLRPSHLAAACPAKALSASMSCRPAGVGWAWPEKRIASIFSP